MSKTRKKLGMQQLEEKALMAGDVAVSFDGTALNINEAADSVGDAQQVQVYQLSNGGIRVQGLGDTRIQSQGFLGDIPITIYRSYLDINGFNSNDDINVNLGGGNDSFTMYNYNGGVDARDVEIRMGGSGADSDRVSISGLTTKDELRVWTGAGNDQVSVSNSSIGDGSWEDLEVYAGAGADTVDVTMTDVRDDAILKLYDSVWENDADTVNVQYLDADDMYADLGNGNDSMSMSWSNLDYVDIDLGYEWRDEYNYGQDNDYLYLGYNTMDDVEIYGRDGSDTVRAAYNTADDVDFDGGSGTDRYYRWLAWGGQDSNDFDDLDLFSASLNNYGYV